MIYAKARNFFVVIKACLLKFNVTNSLINYTK